MDLEFRAARSDESPGRELLLELNELLNTQYAGRVRKPRLGDHPGRDGAAGRGIPGRVRGERAVAVGGVRRLSDDVGEIKRMYVVPDARSHGVGRALLTALEEACRELGYDRVRLDAGPAQTHSKSLFERTGYVQIPRYNGNHIADYFAEKDLLVSQVQASGRREQCRRAAGHQEDHRPGDVAGPGRGQQPGHRLGPEDRVEEHALGAGHQPRGRVAVGGALAVAGADVAATTSAFRSARGRRPAPPRAAATSRPGSRTPPPAGSRSPRRPRTRGAATPPRRTARPGCRTTRWPATVGGAPAPARPAGRPAPGWPPGSPARRPRSPRPARAGRAYAPRRAARRPPLRRRVDGGPVRVAGEADLGADHRGQRHVADRRHRVAVADQQRLHAERAGGQRGEHRPVRARPAAGHQVVAAAAPGVGQQVLQPADLVAAEPEAGQVVALEPDLHPDGRGQPRRGLQRRRERAQPDPGLGQQPRTVGRTAAHADRWSTVVAGAAPSADRGIEGGTRSTNAATAPRRAWGRSPRRSRPSFSRASAPSGGRSVPASRPASQPRRSRCARRACRSGRPAPRITARRAGSRRGRRCWPHPSAST